jgi:hypothetical protein
MSVAQSLPGREIDESASCAHDSERNVVVQEHPIPADIDGGQASFHKQNFTCTGK